LFDEDAARDGNQANQDAPTRPSFPAAEFIAGVSHESGPTDPRLLPKRSAGRHEAAEVHLALRPDSVVYRMVRRMEITYRILGISLLKLGR
jgi:hypothetical protein